MSIETPINLDYLIPSLRLHLHDIDSTAYRYTDGWLRVSLVTAVISLQRWWSNKYLVDSTYNVYRNDLWTYTMAEPEVIQQFDETPVILMASFLIKSGVLESNSWSIGSWRDAEYAVSNIESGRIKDAGLMRDWNMLLMYMKPPQKRLNPGSRVSFEGIGADELS